MLSPYHAGPASLRQLLPSVLVGFHVCPFSSTLSIHHPLHTHAWSCSVTSSIPEKLYMYNTHLPLSDRPHYVHTSPRGFITHELSLPIRNKGIERSFLETIRHVLRVRSSWCLLWVRTLSCVTCCEFTLLIKIHATCISQGLLF